MSRRLLDYIEKTTLKNGYSVINLDLRETQEAAISLYESAGFQLIGLLGHFAPFLAQERLAWALVTLLWGVWTLVSITVFFGVWEVMADRRFAREGRDGARMDHGGGARAAATVE